MTDFRPFDIGPQIFADLANLEGNREWFTEGDDEVCFLDCAGSVYAGIVSDDTIAAIAAQPINSAAAHIHLVFHTRKRARKLTAAKALLFHVRQLMQDMTLFCLVPADNRGIQGIIKRVGLRQVGTLTGAHRRHMARHDMLIFEVQ